MGRHNPRASSHREVSEIDEISRWATPLEEDLQIARELPRFPPGTRVECKYEGRFCKGTVVGNYYREPDFEPDYFAPYQVQLDDADGGDLIYINYDHDESIRAAA